MLSQAIIADGFHNMSALDMNLTKHQQISYAEMEQSTKNMDF